VETFIPVLIALFVLQFSKGYFYSKGYSSLKMAAIGACLSASVIAIYAVAIGSTQGFSVLIERVFDFKGIAILLAFVLVFSMTYAFHRDENERL